MRTLNTLFKTSTILFALVIASCSSSITSEEIVKTRKADAVKKFEQFYTCYEMALKLPPVEENGINWETEDANSELGKSNIYHIGIENFKDLSQPLDVPLDGMRRKEASDMAAIFSIDLSARKKEHNYENEKKYSAHTVDSEYSKNAILHFLDTKYLMISRNYTEKTAFVTGEDSFEKGYVVGEVLVFDVLEEKYLGGYKFDATGNSSVQDSWDGGASNVSADQEMSVAGAITDGFKNYTPWVKGSFYPS